MKLTPDEICALAAGVIAQAQALQSSIAAAKAALDLHNAEPGAQPVNVAPLAVALGFTHGIIEHTHEYIPNITPAKS